MLMLKHFFSKFCKFSKCTTMSNTSCSSIKDYSFNVCWFFLKTRENDVSVNGLPAVPLGAINALFSLLAVVGNALILIAIWRKTSFRTPSYILLAGLAATDFGTGLITQPLYAGYIFGRLNCIVITAADFASRYFAIVTSETITVMAVERWLHMSRRSLITARRAFYIYGVLALLPLLYLGGRLWLLSIQSYRKIWEPLLLGIFSTVCFVTTSLSYFKVFQIIRHQQRQIQASQASQCFTQSVITLKYKKSVFTVLYILLLFVLCFSPYVIYSIVNALLTKSATKSSILAWHVSATFVLMSSSLSPILYCWRMKEIRDSVKLMIKNLTCKLWP